MGGEVEQIFFFLSGGLQFLEIRCIDDDMTGRAGHHTLARALERLACGPGDVEQPLARFRGHFLVEGSVSLEKPHQCHATRCSCARAAATIWWQASVSSCTLV